jgi:hypothetical protein
MARAKTWPYGEEGTSLGGGLFSEYNSDRPDFEATQRQSMGQMATRKKHFDEMLQAYERDYGAPESDDEENLDQYAKRLGLTPEYEKNWAFTKNFSKYLPGKDRANDYLNREFNDRYGGFEDREGKRKGRAIDRLTQGLPEEEQNNMKDTVGEFFTPGNPYYNPVDFEDLMRIYNQNKDYDNPEDY